jgi:hypothetical protein
MLAIGDPILRSIAVAHQIHSHRLWLPQTNPPEQEAHPIPLFR